ncbi:MAG: glutaredoxin family protein [Geodermatophilaceae bacterium]|nr:glutaredoxin family protein [Geodermatophilaceae bacterium]
MLKPDDRVVVYMRPGCHVCARVKNFLTEHNVPFDGRDVDSDPLTPRELWDLFNRKADRLRVPFTALNDGEDVVLGFDPQRLEGVFVHGELGGVQVASAVTAPVRYDEFSTPDIDAGLWDWTSGGPSASTNGCAAHRVETGNGRLLISASGEDVGLVSTQRFGTPPGSVVAFGLTMSFEATGGAGTVGPAVGEVSLRDLPTGVALGFEVTNEVILAVHRRSGPPGVAAEGEHYAHRVLTDVETEAGRDHEYRISYQHDTSQARWYVDERCIYAAISPLQVEGVSLGLGIRAGQDKAVATWTPWEITGV